MKDLAALDCGWLTVVDVPDPADASPLHSHILSGISHSLHKNGAGLGMQLHIMLHGVVGQAYILPFPVCKFAYAKLNA